jgi:tryptophan synthase beta chain
VVPVTSGRGTLKDAMNDALRDWVTNVATRSTASARWRARTRTRPWCAISSRSSARKRSEQIMERRGPPARHDHCRIGGGSNAMGLFYPFLDDKRGRHHRRGSRRQGRDKRWSIAPPHRWASGRAAWQPHLPAAGRGRPDPRRHSISAGLDYPGIGPEHAWLHDIGRAEYVSITDDEALAAFQLCCKTEGIIPALEPSHALAHVIEDGAGAAKRPPDGDEHVRAWRQGHLHR